MKKLFLVAAKLIGLLQLYWAFSTLLNIGAALGFSPVEGQGQFIWPFLAGTLLYSILSFGVAYLLVAKTETLARIVGLTDDDPLPQIPAPDKLLRVGILLLGVYFLFTPIPGAVKSMVDVFTYSESARQPAWIARALSSACQVGLALFLLTRPDKVIALLAIRERTSSS